MLTLEDIQQNLFLFYAYAFFDIMKSNFLLSSSFVATFSKRLPNDLSKLTCLEVADGTFKDFYLIVVGI